MFKKAVLLSIAAGCVALGSHGALASEQERTFPAKSGGKLTLDLEAGGSVEIVGTETSAVTVVYTSECTPECEVTFEETSGGLTITTDYVEHARHSDSDIHLRIRVPARFDVEFDSMGGGLSIDGVEGTFTGETHGGELVLHAVSGRADLRTMGGAISVTDSELDGSLETMGGEVTFENVVGDVRGSSMGGDVSYKNVRRRDGGVGSPGGTAGRHEDVTDDTVQISTMGGDIKVDDAPEGASLDTMGGRIAVKNARRFVRAKTMGGDIVIEAIDGWVDATTMGGDIDVALTGQGGKVDLTSMSGDITVLVPKGFGMDLELEIAFTRNSSRSYSIDVPGDLEETETPDWDHEHGTPRKYIRVSGAVSGGGHAVRIKTVNGDIEIREEGSGR